MIRPTSTPVSDATALGTLTEAVADALFLLSSNAAGDAARKVAITTIVRAILQATDAAGVRSAIGAGTGNALTSGTLAQFASTTSAQLAAVLSDETGSGAAVFGTGPTLSSPVFSGLTAGRAVYVGAGGVLADALTGAVTLPREVSSTSAAGYFPLLINRDAVLGGGIAFRVGPDGAVDAGGTINTGVGIRVTAFGAYMGVLAGSRFEFQSSRIDVFNTLSVPSLRSVPTSPASISTTQNNYSPGTALNLRLTASTPTTITGMVAGLDGEKRYLWNVGSEDITLAHNDAGSTAANRFQTSTKANVVVQSNGCALLMYDGTTAAWRVVKLG